MKKLLLAICLVFLSTTASADYWRQTSSLLPGTYMLTYFHQQSTTEMLALQEYAEAQGLPSTIKVQYLMETIVITIDAEFNTKKLVEYLNAEPQTTGPVLFKQDKIGWAQILMPCELAAGDVGA